MNSKTTTAGSALTVSLVTALIIGAVVLCALGGGVRMSLNVATLSAFVIGALSIVPAARSAALPPTVRHLYNSHYAAFFGAFSFLAAMVIVGAVSDDRVLLGIAGLGIVMSGIWSVAHLWAGVGATGAQSLRCAAAAACAAMALFHPHPLVVLLCAAGAFGAAKISLPREPLEKPGPGWGMLSFILLNMIVIIGPTVVLISYVFALFKQSGEETMTNIVHSVPNVIVPSIEDLPDIKIVMLARPVIALTGACAVAIASLAWPRITLTATQRGLCCACIPIAAGIGGQLTFPLAAIAAVISVIVLIPATALGAFAERNRRTPAAIATFAVAFTIIVQSLAVFPASAGEAFLAWMADMMVLLIVWLIGYFAGIRLLRNAMKAKPAAESA